MGKHRARAPAPMDDFRPFYLKNGKLWVPYRSGDDWLLHFLEPEKAWLAVNNAVGIPGNAGQVVPFAWNARGGKRA